jgi:hypothetical protein
LATRFASFRHCHVATCSCIPLLHLCVRGVASWSHGQEGFWPD